MRLSEEESQIVLNWKNLCLINSSSKTINEGDEEILKKSVEQSVVRGEGDMMEGVTVVGGRIVGVSYRLIEGIVEKWTPNSLAIISSLPHLRHFKYYIRDGSSTPSFSTLSSLRSLSVNAFFRSVDLPLLTLFTNLNSLALSFDSSSFSPSSFPPLSIYYLLPYK